MNEKRNKKHLVRERAPLKKEKYTYGDYLSWADDKRYELIEGEVYLMAAPSRRHQEVAGELFRQLATYLLGKECRVYQAPFDVRLPLANEENEDIETVVQPDIVVICDNRKLDQKGCIGVPDLVVEVVSPSSGARDRKTKRDLYEERGVKEYWIVDYINNTVEVYLLNEEKQYDKLEVYTAEDKLAVNILSSLKIDLELVFRE